MTDATIPCACGRDTGTERKAIAVDPDVKNALGNRLRRIEGQVRGLQKMVDEERYCADILTQVASVQEALRGVGKTLLGNHLRHCATQAISSDDPGRRDAMYNELVDLFYRNAK